MDQPSSAPAMPRTSDASDQHERAEHETLKLLITQLLQFRTYFWSYVNVKTDKVKLTLRITLLWTVVATLFLVAVAGLIVSANWFVLSGTADGLSVLFGNRIWAGKIIAGMLFLAGLGIAARFALAKWRVASHERTVQKYARMQVGQQTEFGRSASDQAAAFSDEI
ncbi:MAG: hypothetical protein HZA51_14560 [Planctomycetes bacterium]|nr:hypothetical protein [Planctomycetota bacterium]